MDVYNALCHRTTDDIQQFIRNGLLTSLVVNHGQFLYQFIAIVGRNLHGHRTCRMFGCIRVEQNGVDLHPQYLRKLILQLLCR